MDRSRRPVTVAIAIAALAVVLGACGGSPTSDGAAQLASGDGGAATRALVDSDVAVAAPAGPSNTLATVAPRDTVPMARPQTTTPTTAAPAASVPARCAAARADVQAAGLTLPAGFRFMCAPAAELFAGDRTYWGTMCHHHTACPTDAYVAANLTLIGANDARLRYVIAHEICHALDAAAKRRTTEPGADACAKEHGFPRV